MTNARHLYRFNKEVTALLALQIAQTVLIRLPIAQNVVGTLPFTITNV